MAQGDLFSNVNVNNIYDRSYSNALHNDDAYGYYDTGTFPTMSKNVFDGSAWPSPSSQTFNDIYHATYNTSTNYSTGQNSRDISVPMSDHENVSTQAPTFKAKRVSSSKPPSDSSQTDVDIKRIRNRREQNREAQRSYRRKAAEYLASVETSLEELRKNHELLSRRYTELESRYEKLRGQKGEEGGDALHEVEGDLGFDYFLSTSMKPS